MDTSRNFDIFESILTRVQPGKHRFCYKLSQNCEFLSLYKYRQILSCKLCILCILQLLLSPLAAQHRQSEVQRASYGPGLHYQWSQDLLQAIAGTLQYPAGLYQLYSACLALPYLKQCPQGPTSNWSVSPAKAESRGTAVCKTRTTAFQRPFLPSCLKSRTSSDPCTFSNVRGDERSPAVTKLPSMTSGETGGIQQWPRYPLQHQWRPAETQVPLSSQESTPESFLNFRVPSQFCKRPGMKLWHFTKTDNLCKLI